MEYTVFAGLKDLLERLIYILDFLMCILIHHLWENLKQTCFLFIYSAQGVHSLESHKVNRELS